MAKILEMDKPKDSKVKETEEIDPSPAM